MSKGIIKLLAFDISQCLYDLGFRNMYGRYSNIITYTLAMRDGGELTAKIKII